MNVMNVINTAFALLFVFCSGACKKDSPPVDKVGEYQFSELANLPDVINESSGLEVVANDLFLSFNDSGGEAALYEFDKTGTITRTIHLNNAKNKDWEDIAQDEQGNIYVGDFGNNDNDRRDLVIYKIDQSDFANALNTVDTKQISFSFPTQAAFPPPKPERLFDIESMFSKGEFLYLLTKDRTNPFRGITQLYRLPNTAGTYAAEYLGEFVTDSDKDKGRITAADLSPDGQVMAMISNEKLWLFQNFAEDQFFSGDIKELDLPVQLDMEGMVFGDSCSLYLSNEDKPNAPAVLYEILLCQ